VRFYDNTCLLVLRVNSSLLAATIPFTLSYNSLAIYITCGHSILHRPPDVNINDLDADRFKYTDGTFMTAFSDVVPDFGYERTGFPTLARSILIQANQLEYVEDSV